MKKEETVSVSIPASLYKTLEKRIVGSSFAIAELSDQQTVPFSKEEEDKVRERLRALGYVE
jgi:hypothetical protein